jgi:hypothetical protein
VKAVVAVRISAYSPALMHGIFVTASLPFTAALFGLPLLLRPARS